MFAHLKKTVSANYTTVGLIAVAVWYIVSVLRFADRMPVAAWGDTTTYQNMSRLSLFDANFWAGRYPLTTPLLHKICSTQPDCIARFQVGLSIGAWLALGVAVILLIENRLMRIVSFAALMGLSLSSNFIGMNKVLLSESLSNSLFVLMTASWLLAGRYLSNNRALHQQVIVVFLLMPMMILWVFTRDPNAWYLLAVVVLLALTVFLRRSTVRPAIIMLMIALGVIVAFQYYTVNRSQRLLKTFPVHIFYSILPYPDRTEFFADHGMPVSDELLALTRNYDALDTWPTDFEMWLYEDGQRTYTLYLLSFPQVTLRAPLDNWQTLLASETFSLARTFDQPPTQQRRMDAIFYYPGGFWLLALLMTPIVLLVFLLRRGMARWYWFMPLAMLVMVYPMMFLIWHGGVIEIPRIANGLNLQLRLGGWLLIAFLVDGLLSLRQQVHAAQRLARRLTYVIGPLLLLEALFSTRAIQNEVLLPMAVNIAPQNNVLGMWGVPDLQHQLYVDEVRELVPTDAVLVSPGVEGHMTRIEMQGWNFTTEDGIADASTALALRQWLETMQPAYLRPLGGAYVYLDSDWWMQASAVQLEQFENPAAYQLLKVWEEDDGTFRRLYRIGDLWGNDTGNTETLGLSEQTFAQYEAYVAQQQLIAQGAVVFNPASGLDWFDSVAALGNLVQTLADGENPLPPLFDLMQVWQQASYEDDLGLDADAQAALEAWRTSKMPGHLLDAGIDYLFYSDLWESYLTQEEFDRLYYSGLYEIVAEWEDGIPGQYTLLRPISDAR